MQLIIITGRPGTGKTAALRVLTRERRCLMLGGEHAGAHQYSREALLHAGDDVRVLCLDDPGDGAEGGHVQAIADASEAAIIRERFDTVLVTVRTSRDGDEPDYLGALRPLLDVADHVLRLEAVSAVNARSAES